MKGLIRIGFCLAIAGLFASCSYNSVEELRDLANQCDTTGVTFSQDIQPIIQNTCSDTSHGSCHAAGSYFGDYTSYQGLKSKVDNGSLNTRTVVLRDMPPSNTQGPPALGSCEMDKIAAWIAAGAPNN